MSEAENHPPASSVTALRIPIIKKGEYDLWCMKMRQYIAITDHILWDIITYGDQATTEPASSSGQPSAPKTSNVVNARRNNEKALNILLSAIPDRHLLSFHDAQDAKSLWAAIKARFGDFQNIISMLELYDAKVSCEDANLKFLRSLPSVWHVVATMIRGQPGLDELDFDDLYNNLKYSRQNETICSSFASTSSMLESCDEDLLQMMMLLWEEINIGWNVAMITARYRRRLGHSLLGNASLLNISLNRANEVRNKDLHDDPVNLYYGGMNGIEEDELSIEIDDLELNISSSEGSNNIWGDETLTGPLYENFKREKAYKAVPPPTGTIIPPRADVAFTGIDELAIRNKVINKQNSESSGTDHESCESKNRDDLIKNKEQTQNTVKSNTDRNKVIIEDWVDSDDEEVPLGFSEIKKQTVLKSETSSVNKIPRSKDSFGQRSRRRGLGYRDGKVCFVCYSPDHLIKDCDLHERNLKQTQKPKPLETQGSRDSRSVWNNTRRVNHRNFTSDYRHPHQRRSFIPSAVLTREGLKSTVRSKMSQAVPSQSTARSFYQNTARPNGNPEEEIKDHAIIDSGCSGSMTGDKDKLKQNIIDFERRFDAILKGRVGFNSARDATLKSNADFHDVIDFLTGCYVNYALLVSPDVIQQWIQQFWNTAKVRMINEVAHIEAKVAGKKILVSEASVRTDLMFNDEDGTICFDNQKVHKSSCFERPASPNDYTPTDEVQTSGGDEGNLDLYGLTREVLNLKKQNAKQAAQILRLKTKINILVKKVKPVIAEYSSFSVKYFVDVNSSDSQMMDVDDNISAEVNEGTGEVNEGVARKVCSENRNEEDGKKRLAGLERLQAELEDYEMIAAEDTTESSAPKRSTVIRFRLPERRSTRLTPPVPVPTVEKADEMILQDTLQVSLAEHKSREEKEVRENVELVNKHLASEEIEKLVEGSENVIDDSLPPRNDEPQIPGTRLEPRSDKESPEVERTNDEEVEVTNVVIPVNVNEEEDEITDEVYELKRREKEKVVEESRSTSLPTPIRSPRTHTNLVSLDTEKLQELTETHTQTTSSSRSQHTKLSRANRLLSLFKAKPARFKRYKIFFQELQGRYTYLFEHLKERFLSRKSFDTLADHLQEVMVESLPTMVDTHIKEQVKKQVPKQAEISSQIQKAIDHHIPSQVDASVPQTTCRPSAVRLRDQDGPHDDAHPEGENSAKRQKTSEYEAYVSGELSSGQVNEEERGPSTLGNQEQEDDYDFWTDSYASDDDEIPTKQVS
ncbi:hypothetical protein Tco_0321326 [Tanacetum coccineum]